MDDPAAAGGTTGPEKAIALLTLGAAVLLAAIAIDTLRPRPAPAADDSTGE